MQSQGPTATRTCTSWGRAADGAEKHTDVPESGGGQGTGPLWGKTSSHAGQGKGLDSGTSWTWVQTRPCHSLAVQVVTLSEPPVSCLYKGGLDLTMKTRCPSEILGATWAVAQRRIPEAGKFFTLTQTLCLSGLCRYGTPHGPH